MCLCVNNCRTQTQSERSTVFRMRQYHVAVLAWCLLSLYRFDEGVVLCESLLQFCPESCTLRDALAELHIRRGDADQAVRMWLHALVECPNNAEVFYHSCKFLMKQVRRGHGCFF